jgi:DNA-binding NarL/FixJ family response regulator
VHVVIAEDSVLLRAGIQRLLADEDIETVAAVEDGDGLLVAVSEHRPDLAIVDVRMPPTFRDEGIRAAIEARRVVPGLPVLVLSQYVETSYATELLADSPNGVGYLLKDRVGQVSHFLDALSRVAGGGTVMDPEVVAQLLTRRAGDPVDALSPREREVLALMAEGHGNQEIRERLFIAETSVQKHIGSIFGKLGLPASETGHRRVLAVLAYLNSQRGK